MIENGLSTSNLLKSYLIQKKGSTGWYTQTICYTLHHAKETYKTFCIGEKPGTVRLCESKNLHIQKLTVLQ